LKVENLRIIIVVVFAVMFIITGCSTIQTPSTTTALPTTMALPTTTALPTTAALPTTTALPVTRASPATPATFPIPTTLSVDESFNGKEVIIAPEGSLQVALNSNPTTGFKWELTQNSDTTVLEKLSNIFETPMVKRKEGEPPLVGAGGKEFWNFKALKKGKSTLSMEYSQSWEGGKKGAQKFSLTVDVQ
jgi:predicted secreted protein